MRAVAILGTVALLASLLGCDGGGEADAGRDADPDGEDGGEDGGRDSGGDAPLPCLAALAVDLLWVIDNSNSMREEQNSLAANFSSLVEVLTSPRDADGDGREDYPPVEDLRVAVVTTDMGVGNDRVMGCDMTGDRGVFVTRGSGEGEGCAELEVGPPAWLELRDGDASALARDFACLARLGTGGCGFEQQLEAAVVALTDRAAPGEPNEGFVRADSLLAIVLVTDEDDCSAADPSIFDPAAALGPLSTRCALHHEMLHPISRFVAALDPFRLDRRGGLVMAAITGVPPALVRDPTSIDFDALLADEAMQIRLDPADDTIVLPACSSPGVGSAVPARRIVELVRTLSPAGERGLVQSICSSDLRPAMEAIGALIAGRLCDQVY